MFDNVKVAVLGAGKLGEALISGLVDAGLVRRDQFIATAAHQQRLDVLGERLQVATTLSNADAVREAQLVLICVKPQTVAEVIREIRGWLTPEQVVISVAASVGTGLIENLLDQPIPVVRAMPNTPCLIRCGMTALSPGKFANSSHLMQAKAIFESLGRCLVLDEKHMDAVTGLSASGPAFVYIIIESFVEAGVKVGLPREVATLLAAQMVYGASSMVLETGEHPAKLKDGVTTPAGCTIDGILELEDGGLRVTLIKAVVKATERAKELVHG